MEIHKAGLQATAHAVGDRAIDMWLTAIERAQETYPRKDARHRIEHCAIASQDLIERIRKLDMIPTANAGFFETYGERYVRFYGERIHQLFPLKAFLNAGIHCCIATTVPSSMRIPCWAFILQ